MVPRLIDHCDQLGNSYGAAGSDFLDAAPKPIFKGDARFFCRQEQGCACASEILLPAPFFCRHKWG
jgi:hypothetical protein